MCKTDHCFEGIFNLLKSIQVKINEYFKTNAQNYGLNMTEFLILYEIDYHEGLSLNELSKMLDLPKSTVSRIVDQLVNKGLVLRIIPQEDRRMINLYVNQNFLKSQETDLMKGINKLVDDMEQEKADRIISALEELKQVLNNHK
ncbi:MAG: helix-turn-helix domain-containing protein [Dehalobacterium sp.]